MTGSPAIFWGVGDALRWIKEADQSCEPCAELHNALASGRIIAYGRPLESKPITARRLGNIFETPRVVGYSKAPGRRTAVPAFDWADIRINLDAPFFVSADWAEIFINGSDIMTAWPQSKKVRASVRQILACQNWIEAMRRDGPPPDTKAALRQRAENQFKIGPRQFDRAWEQAAVAVQNQAWGRSGRPRKNRT